MAEIKLTKNELRLQQSRLLQLEKYLPTLQLKKALLQTEVGAARLAMAALQQKNGKERSLVEASAALFTADLSASMAQVVHLEHVHKRWENIAGVDVPLFEAVTFAPCEYFLFDTPAWFDALLGQMRCLITTRAELSVVNEKKVALEKELREVSIRVNLFEKILIPRAQTNIKKIALFLGDQQLAAIIQAKVAKGKILTRKGGE